MTAPLIPDGLDATIVLLRHGESEFIVERRFQGRAETPLSPIGHRQAELAGDRLANPARSPALPVPDGPPVEIVHSPLTRTRQTAEAIAAAIDGVGGAIVAGSHGADERPSRVAIRPEPGIVEIGQGAWEGLTHDEVQARYGEVLAAWRRTPTEAWAPDGEPLREVQARVRPAVAGVITRLAERRPPRPGAAGRSMVSGYGGAHHGPWTILVGHDGIFKVTLLTLLDLPLERFWAFSFALGGISVVDFLGGRPVLRAHNLVEHLAPLLDEQAIAETEERERSGAL